MSMYFLYKLFLSQEGSNNEELMEVAKRLNCPSILRYISRMNFKKPVSVLDSYHISGKLRATFFRVGNWIKTNIFAEERFLFPDRSYSAVSEE